MDNGVSKNKFSNKVWLFVCLVLVETIHLLIGKYGLSHEWIEQGGYSGVLLNYFFWPLDLAGCFTGEDSSSRFETANLYITGFALMLSFVWPPVLLLSAVRIKRWFGNRGRA